MTVSVGLPRALRMASSSCWPNWHTWRSPSRSSCRSAHHSVGGLSAQSSGLFGGSSGGGSSLDTLFSTGKGIYSAVTSGFGSAVSAGWSAGEGFLGGMQGAISNGSSYISSGLSGLFGSGGLAPQAALRRVHPRPVTPGRLCRAGRLTRTQRPVRHLTGRVSAPSVAQLWDTKTPALRAVRRGRPGAMQARKLGRW